VEGRPLRLPPKIKVLEAAGSIADGRVRVLEDRGSKVVAVVESSMGDRSYNVVIEITGPKLIVASSNDNGTRFRGYIGYPIISLLMIKGLIPRDQEVEEALKGIPWRVLNEQYKSYERVLEEIIARVKATGGERLVSKVRGYMENVMSILSKYEVYSRGGSSS
jgi:hypothetical protein